MKYLYFFVGFFVALIACDLSPVFSIGFWRLAVSRDCFITGNFDATRGERLLSQIICSRGAETSLRLLYNVGTDAAGVYAIYGLGIIDSQYYDHYVEDFEHGPGYVVMRGGSSDVRLSKHEIAELLKAKYQNRTDQH